jgi:hypothetical protein
LVDDFDEYGYIVRHPQSQAQTVAKAYINLRETDRFMIALLQWNKKSSNYQNWINFKTHFRQGQRDLNNIQGPTLQASDLNAYLVQSVVEGVQQALLPIDDQMPDIFEQVVNSVAKTSSTNEQLQLLFKPKLTRLNHFNQFINHHINHLVEDLVVAGVEVVAMVVITPIPVVITDTVGRTALVLMTALHATTKNRTQK